MNGVMKMENNEMTEREMLEFAAKAVGITLKPMEVKNVEFMGDDHFIGFMTDATQWERGWFDPIGNDSDAMILVSVFILDICNWSTSVMACSEVTHASVDIKDHICRRAAMRLAITMAVAKIGKLMA
jgi:hypothetical protein